MSLRRTKSINQTDKDIVIGYVKDVQRLINAQQIPMVVTYLCLMYFFYEIDHFDKAGKNIKINDRGDILTAVSCEKGTCYGKLNIGADSNNIPFIFSWTFNIISRSSFIYIGLDSSKNNASTQSLFYALSDWGSTGTATTTEQDIFQRNPAWSYREGDIVEMKLNVKQQKLKYFINDKDIGCVIDVEFGSNIKYNMAVLVGHSYMGTRIHLVNFEKRLA